jgi:hypothetical protein
MKKQKSGGIFSLLYNFAVGLFLGSLMLMPIAGAIANTVAGFIPRSAGLYSGVNKEIWISTIMEGFYPKADWLSRVVDMSAFVEFNTINLADAGVDPNVLLNNTSFPVASAVRTDTAIALALETLDSENTIVRNIEKIETAYDKLSSVTGQHQKAIRTKCYQRAAFNYAPATDTANHPLFDSTGAADGTGLTTITLKDITKMQMKFNDLDLPEEGRFAILTPRDLQALLNANETLANQYANLVEGKVLRLAGFDLFVFSKNPVYNKTTKAKKSWGAVAAPSTDSTASVFVCPGEVMKADGTYDVFITQNDPGARGDILGFQKRFLATSIRSKGIGAIVGA